jgi:hypothetical protein
VERLFRESFHDVRARCTPFPALGVSFNVGVVYAGAK